MSCNTNYIGMNAIALDCTDKPVGGLKGLKFAVLSDIKALSESAGTVAIPSAKLKAISFNTKDGATNFTEIATNQPNGSQSIVPTITTQMNGINEATRESLEKLSNPMVRLCVIAQTYDGVWWLFGRKYGLIVSEVTSGTGASNADFNGYNVTFSGEEDDFAIPCTITSA